MSEVAEEAGAGGDGAAGPRAPADAGFAADAGAGCFGAGPAAFDLDAFAKAGDTDHPWPPVRAKCFYTTL